MTNVFYAGEFSRHPQAHPTAWGFKETRVGHRILRLQRLLHGDQWNAQGRQLGVGNFHPDLFVLQADQLHLAHIVHTLQGQLQAVGVVFHDGVVETRAGEGINIAEGGAEFVVKERPTRILGQGMANITHLLAHLVPQVLDLLGAHFVTSHKHDQRLTRAGVGRDALEVTGFHQLLFDTLSDLPGDFFSAGAGPLGIDGHQLEGERRVFALPQAGIGDRSHDAEKKHGVEHQSAVLQRPFREIE